MSWVGLRCRVLAVPAFAVFLAACGGSGQPPEPPSLTPFGLLPVPTLTPRPIAPTTQQTPVTCPPLPSLVCLAPGDGINVYQELPLQTAASLGFYRYEGGVSKAVYDPTAVQRILGLLDRNVALESYGFSNKVRRSGEFRLTVVWREGEGVRVGDGSIDRLEFQVDGDSYVMGNPLVELQWPVPPAFVDLLLASLTDWITPTPRPSPTPTPTVVPARTVFFDYPKGKLRWYGPDDRVSTKGEDHCGAPPDLKRDFGIPAVIEVKGDRGLRGFWAIQIVRREDDWRWTGYYRDDWQLWQGENGRTLYLAHAEEPRIAFEYRAIGCD